MHKDSRHETFECCSSSSIRQEAPLGQEKAWAKHEDPEGIELQTTLRHVSFEGKEVLEIGCGNGRLTFKYAGMAKRVFAIDPDEEEIEKARRSTPSELSSKVEFRVGKGEELLLPDESYDIVFYTWSLCCISSPYHMKKALEEAWRVVRPGGMLVSIQSSLQQPFHRGVVTYLITNRFGSLADTADDKDGEARLALKYVTLIEGKFNFLAEEQFPVNRYYRTVEDALSDTLEDKREQYSRLDERTKQKIHDIFMSFMTERGVLFKENAALTVLTKAGPNKRGNRNRLQG